MRDAVAYLHNRAEDERLAGNSDLSRDFAQCANELEELRAKLATVSPTPTAGEARVTEIARIIDPDDFEHEWAFETARAIASLPASPPDKGEYEAMLAVMEQIDPARVPGLLMKHRAALGRFAKPFTISPPGEGVMEALREALDALFKYAQELARILAVRFPDEDASAEADVLLAAFTKKYAALSRLSTQGGDAELPTRDKVIHEVADFIASEYPDNDNTNAFCAAIRSLTSADLHRPHPTPGSELSGAEQGDIRWAVNVLLEKIAKKFEAWETLDLWRSDAAMVVRGFKHDLAASPSPNPNAVK